ncbi:LysR family transcriptional regulator [Shewanella psychrotolerans]|uniref:LysR family transcriptional regulator n=1 Tax=Shewanella psychrotolerans TaxID=2864206 RepID=UPI001C65EB7B|nr:LysR family transcriptional regulator [Shewanella psychrotolerans]QYK00875.1 LysR family transcriptional regulator [Shewanella psychrotolerans]
MLKKVSRLDYFTLQVFIGLIELKNGSAVADRMQTTQSKISRSLTCLREVLEDELFVRQQYGFEPNQVALKIYPMVQTVLEQYDKIVATTIDKGTEPYQLSVATYEQWSLMAMNCVHETCHCIEGGVSINILPWTDNIAQRLCQGKIDCSISTEPINHTMVNNYKLGDISYFFIVARTGHPILTSSQPLVDLFNYPLALVNTNLHEQQAHPIEEYATAHNLNIKIALKSPSLRMLVDHVCHCDDIALLSSAMSMVYFENRNDVDYIDVSQLWRETSGIECESYYLHCHKSIKPQLVNCLKTVLTEKLTEMQSHYDAVASGHNLTCDSSTEPTAKHSSKHCCPHGTSNRSSTDGMTKSHCPNDTSDDPAPRCCDN